MKSGSYTHPLAVITAVAAFAALTAGVAKGAPIDAPNTATITVTCPSETISGVVILVRGEFTPAFAIGSNKVFIPVAFGEFTRSTPRATFSSRWTQLHLPREALSLRTASWWSARA
jgi:hypothetical protein